MSNELGDFLGVDFSALPSANVVEGMRRASMDRDSGNSFVESLDGREWLKFEARKERWKFGRQGEILGDDAIAVHPGSFRHGWCCWDNNSNNKGELMVPISEPMPQPDQLPSWKDEGKLSKQYQVDLQVLEGEHIGVPLRFRSNSYGGTNAVQDLMGKIADRLEMKPDSPFMIPVVELDSDPYEHEQWGATANPVFKIIDWADADGKRESEVSNGEETPAAVAAPPETSEAADDGDDGGAIPLNENGQPMRRRRAQ